MQRQRRMSRKNIPNIYRYCIGFCGSILSIIYLHFEISSSLLCFEKIKSLVSNQSQNNQNAMTKEDRYCIWFCRSIHQAYYPVSHHIVKPKNIFNEIFSQHCDLQITLAAKLMIFSFLVREARSRRHFFLSDHLLIMKSLNLSLVLKFS